MKLIRTLQVLFHALMDKFVILALVLRILWTAQKVFIVLLRPQQLISIHINVRQDFSAKKVQGFQLKLEILAPRLITVHQGLVILMLQQILLIIQLGISTHPLDVLKELEMMVQILKLVYNNVQLMSLFVYLTKTYKSEMNLRKRLRLQQVRQKILQPLRECYLKEI